MSIVSTQAAETFSDDDLPRIIRGTTDGANCVACPFARMGAPNRPVVGEGSERPIWIIVGESPGQNETEQLRPFCGASGRLVNEALARIRVKRESIYVTNACACQPPPGATDVMKKQARACCAPRLQQELAQFPGRPIAALGAVAAQGFCGDKFSISQMAGAYHEVDIATRLGAVVDGVADVRVVFPTTHPAAILRGGSGGSTAGSHTSDLAFWNLVYDLQKTNLIARGVDIRFTDDVDIEVEDSARAEALIATFVAEVRKGRFVAIDTETYVDDPKRHSALQPVNAKLKAIGLAHGGRGISVAWAILTPRAKRLLRAVTADTGITKAFHNSIYDIPVLARHGMPVNGVLEDTMLLHHSAFPGLAHNLQRVATQFFAVTPWKSEYRAGQGAIDELCKYNGKDALSTARLYAPLFIAITKTNSLDTYKVDMAMAQAAAQMHVVGVPIDRETNERLRVGFRAHVDKARDEIIAKAFDESIHDRLLERLAFEQSRRIRKHDPMDLDARIALRTQEMTKKPFQFQLDSGDHVVALLKALGVPLSLQTKTGRISTKKDVLESFGHYAEVRSLLTYRENAKLLSTYIERMYDREYPNGKRLWGFVDENSRVHPRWSVHKITGRWGSEAPVMQNVPKADKKKGRPNLRSQVIAPKGRLFVGFDFKGLEARLIALLSADPFLVQCFSEDRDLHSELSQVVWPDFYQKPADERKVLRDMTKRIEYGSFYAGAVDTLWKAVVRDFPNVTIGMVGKMVATMKTKMPGVSAWHQRMMRVADREGEVRSIIFGRRRAFPLKQFDLSEVVNFPIQSSAADLMNRGLMNIMPKLSKTTFPILQIHDAAVFECDEDDADKLKETVVDCFTQEVTHEGVTIQFPIDVKVGKSWAEV